MKGCPQDLRSRLEGPAKKGRVILAAMVVLTLAAGASVAALGHIHPGSVGFLPHPPHRTVEALRTQTDQPIKVLFIGNSLTYYNNLPHLLEHLAASSDVPRKLRTKLVGFGGATLHDHWQRGNALKAIRDEAWDYVVLQEQSSLGTVYMVNGTRWITPDPEFFHQYARLFDEEIRQSGARTIFFLTWARQDSPPREQAALSYAYMQIAGELKAMVAPVGIAWQDARMGESELSLYLGDGSHPSSKGSYLAACVFYALIYQRSPFGLTARISGNPIDDRGVIDLNRTVTLVDLSEADANWLQRVAWQTQRKLAAAGGHTMEPKPPPPRLPALPTGGKAAISDLEGLWKGRINLYQQPGRMELRLSFLGGTWKAQAIISFGGKREDLVPEITEFEVTDTGISFVDSKASASGPAKYQGAFRGKSLSGIAEIIGEDRPFYAVGTWEVKRQR
jgi:hypothetical protein